ncbi:MAG: hypothetical protein WD063_02705 [Pirellulales bacterium]
MIGRTFLGALVAVASLAVSVTSARACHLFDGCCGRPTTTYYAPACCPQPQPACCPQPQVVNYMPQTCYRTVYVNAPVVAYQPTTCCDPCGRATTVMRPVTTYVTQARLVPYTTYRPVVATVAQPCCGAAVPAATYYAPVVSTAPRCCTPVSATTYTPAPSLTTYSPAPVASPVPAGTALQNVTPAPSLNSAPSAAEEPKAFESSPLDANQPQSRMLLPPSTSNLSKRPYGPDPESQDRTTAVPLRYGPAVRQASLVVPAKADIHSDDNDGWRASSR